MCGILGQRNARKPIDSRVFDRMLATLASRGPDGSGTRFFDDGRVALGHRRLAIIDLSEAGAQPMPNENGTVWLTFNGEIYNYRALREELLRAGHRFRSESDSEVIVHGYEEWGDACVEHLRGIFAFAIWDTGRKRFFLARDHLGVKPLYYTTNPDRFAFASQPRAILADPTFEREPDLAALRDYFAYGTVPYDVASFKGMAKLPAAHTLVLENGRITVRRYWELEYQPRIVDAGEAQSLLREKLEEVVQMQIVSDVPIGLFLSGGVDSSIITALACERVAEPIETFTIGFQEQKMDERPFARLVAERYHTKHNEQVLDYETALSLIGNLVEAYDEPYYLGSAFPTYQIAALVRSKGLKVILAGDGADELFAGYLRYDDFHYKLTSSRSAYLRDSMFRSLKRLRLEHPRGDPMAYYFQQEGLLGWKEQAPLFPKRVRREIDSDVLWRLRKFYRPEYPPVVAARYVDVHTFLMDEILCKVDRASMASSVEVRVPFLDPELVQLAFHISNTLTYDGGERKALLKRTFADRLPPEVLSGRKKGFSVPLKDWMKRGIREWAKPLIVEGSLVERGVLDRGGVTRMVERGAPQMTWLLVVAELWARRWLDDAPLDSSLFDQLMAQKV